MVSDLASAEFASVLSRLVRTGDVLPSNATIAFGLLDRWKAQMTMAAETRSADVLTAENLIRRLEFSLRTPDALHVALALRLGAALVTFDRKLERDARSLGVQIASV